MTKNSETFDFIIIGNNWTGWSIALALYKQSQNVALVDSKNHWNHSTLPLEQPDWPQEIEVYPHNPSTINSLEWLSELVDEKVFTKSTINTEPIIWKQNQWTPFMGFGEMKSSSLEHLSPLYIPSAVDTTQPMEVWKQRVVDQCAGVHLAQAELTSIEYKDNQITAIITNGHHRLQAHTYLYCDSPKRLLGWLPEKLIAPSLRQKISKFKTMTRLLLMLKHDEIQNSEVQNKKNALYFFPGGKDYEPFVGRILINSQPQISIWQSLIPDEIAENPEAVGSQLRYMKRQLKRPFSEEFNHPMEEKVLVEPESHGYMSLDHQPTSLKNFWQASPLTQKSNGIIGHLAATQSLHKQIQSVLVAHTPNPC